MFLFNAMSVRLVLACGMAAYGSTGTLFGMIEMPNGSTRAENKLQAEHRQNQKAGNHTNHFAPQWLVYRSIAVVSYSFFNEIALNGREVSFAVIKQT